jgi:6-phosphogluconate dehydrogenase
MLSEVHAMDATVELGFRGLGKMGLNMVRRLRQGNHRVVCHGRTPSKEGKVREVGAEWATTLGEVVGRLTPPRIVWMMVPAEVVDSSIKDLRPLLGEGDILVDGGNSQYKETIRRAGELAAHGIAFVDVGTSGGIWGLEEGYCMMVGGPEAAFKRLEPALATLAPPNGYLHVGPVGAGHFVKMVHNAIEYGMMEAYAEGFELMSASDFDLPLGEIAHLWNHGSVIRSWLLELAEKALAEDPELSSIEGYVEDSGEGRWAVSEGVEKGVPVPVIVHSLMRRFESRQDTSYALRMLAALRHQFGGHAVKPAQEEKGHE